MSAPLFESKDILRKFIQNAPFAAAMFDQQMRYVSASNRWKRDLFLKESDDISGISHYEIFPEITESWKSVHRRALAGEIVSSEQDRFERNDGSIQWLRWDVRPWFTSENVIGGILIYMEEISHLLAVEAAESRYRDLLESAQDGIIIVNTHGIIQSMNTKISTLFDYSKNELCGKSIQLLMPELNGISLTESETLIVKHNQDRKIDSRKFELPARRKDGSEFPVEISLSAKKANESEMLIAILRDITERSKRTKQIEFLAKAGTVLSETLKYEDTLARIIDLVVPDIADGCIVRDFDGDHFRIALARHRNPDSQKRFQDLATQSQQNKILLDFVQESFRTKKPIIVERSEEHFDLSSKMVPQLQEVCLLAGVKAFALIPLILAGKNIGTLSLVIDESKRRFTDSDLPFLEEIATRVTFSLENARLYQEAKNAIKMREDVLAIVSHDLRNPITAIALTSQLIKNHPPANQEKLKSLSENILRSTDLIQRLITDLLDLAKIQSGLFFLEKKSEHLGNIIEPICRILTLEAENKKTNLILEISPELPNVFCDARRITQVVSNLIGNAIKYAPNGGSIRITVIKETREQVVSISDTGPGIPKEQLPKIFDRFWQASENKNLGSGLGLTIAKGIVEAHGGRIWAVSKPGETNFYFSIPNSLQI